MRGVLHLCGKGARQYWAWFVKSSEQMGDYYGPW
jgi:hypothetical protein